MICNRVATLIAIAVTAVGQAQHLPRRGSLGVALDPVPAEVAKNAKLPAGLGATVRQVFPESTAAKAGLIPGDVVVTINGKQVAQNTAAGLIRGIPAGADLVIDIVREGKRETLHATLLEKPKDPGAAKFSVDYSDVATAAGEMRTIISHPKSSGKHAALMFIQGYSPISYDYKLDGSGTDGAILTYFAENDFVTMRVEKPGVGDSEGGPYVDVDFTTETDIYRQALQQLASQPDVDPDRIVLFGHSMGGAFGPIIASEHQVKALIMYGVVARTWHEYLLDITRYQNLLSGSSFTEIDDAVRKESRMFSMVLDEGIPPAKVAADHPELKKTVDENFPGGLFNGKTPTFWGQLEHTNFAAYWSKIDSHVLAVHGASDFVTYDLDHQLIADMVNKRHPGWATFAKAPNSDHLFNGWATEKESSDHFPAGTYSSSFLDIVKPWLAKVMAETA